MVDRRMFIRDFGRGVLGISVGATLLGACGAEAASTTTAVSTTGSAPTTGASTTTSEASTTSLETTSTSGAPATTVPADEPTTTTGFTGTQDMTVEPINLGIVSAYLMVRGQEVAIVDTGGGGRAGDIEQALSEVGLGWNAVSTIILTHKHGDHVGSLTAVLREVTDAVVGAGEADIPSIGGGADLVAFADGQTVFGSTIISTPGHTAGHISVWDEFTRVLIAGDALNGGGSGVQNVDGVGGPNANFTSDMGAGIESARKLAALQPETIFFGHGLPKREDAAAALDGLVADL